MPSTFALDKLTLVRNPRGVALKVSGGLTRYGRPPVMFLALALERLHLAAPAGRGEDEDARGMARKAIEL